MFQAGVFDISIDANSKKTRGNKCNVPPTIREEGLFMSFMSNNVYYMHLHVMGRLTYFEIIYSIL